MPTSLPLRLLFVLLPPLLGVAQSQPSGSYNRAAVQDLLPRGGQSASLLVAVQHPEVQVIGQRIAQAGRLDPVWFRSYFASTQTGGDPPYNARLGQVGVSPQDYQLWVTLKDQTSLVPSGQTVRLSMSRVGSRVVFGSAPGAEALSGLSLDLQTGELRTPEGYVGLPHSAQVSADQDTMNLGARSGYGWAVRGFNVKRQDAMQGNLSLLQLQNGDVLLSYNRISIAGGRSQPEVDLNLLFHRAFPGS